MKKLYYIIFASGFLGLIFAAGASDTGADLLYTIPAALIGVALMAYGISCVRKMERAEQWRCQRMQNNRADYRLGLRRAAGK